MRHRINDKIDTFASKDYTIHNFSNETLKNNWSPCSRFKWPNTFTYSKSYALQCCALNGTINYERRKIEEYSKQNQIQQNETAQRKWLKIKENHVVQFATKPFPMPKKIWKCQTLHAQNVIRCLYNGTCELYRVEQLKAFAFFCDSSSIEAKRSRHCLLDHRR